MAQLFTLAARSTLQAGIAIGATSLTVAAANADLFPVANTNTSAVPTLGLDWFKVILEDASHNKEVIYVRTRALGSAIFSNILRAQEGTAARAFTVGDIVGLRLTAIDIAPANDLAANATTAGKALLNAADAASQRLILGATNGASGSGPDAIGYEVDQLITQSFTVGQSAMVSGAAIAIATPAVITIANLFVPGQPIRFTTTGALPTGLATNGQYFVSATGLTTSSFQIAATAAAAIAGTGSIATTGTQSGIHSAGKCKDIIIPGGLRQATGAGFFLPTGCRAVFP